MSHSHLYDIFAKCCHCRVVVSGCCNCVNLTLQTSATPQPGLRGVTRKPDSSELLYLCVPARFCGVVHTPVAGESWSYPRCKQLSGSSMWWVNNMTSEAVISKLKCHTRTCITASWGTILSWVTHFTVSTLGICRCLSHYFPLHLCFCSILDTWCRRNRFRFIVQGREWHRCYLGYLK